MAPINQGRLRRIAVRHGGAELAERVTDFVTEAEGAEPGEEAFRNAFEALKARKEEGEGLPAGVTHRLYNILRDYLDPPEPAPGAHGPAHQSVDRRDTAPEAQALNLNDLVHSLEAEDARVLGAMVTTVASNNHEEHGPTLGDLKLIYTSLKQIKQHGDLPAHLSPVLVARVEYYLRSRRVIAKDEGIFTTGYGSRRRARTES